MSKANKVKKERFKVSTMLHGPKRLDNESYEDILESVLKGSGHKAHMDVVALNTSLVLWVAGIEDDIEKGFEKALFSMSKAKPWDNFLRLKAYLKS